MILLNHLNRFINTEFAVKQCYLNPFVLFAAVSARWSALRAAATRRGGARRLRRELVALRETLDDVCEPGDCAPQPHTRAQLHRRIEELKVCKSLYVDSVIHDYKIIWLML